MGNSLSEIKNDEVSNEVSKEVSNEILDTIIEEVAGVYTKVSKEKRIKQLEDELFNLEEQYNELHLNYTRLMIKNRK
jgi:hypothetical protein